MKRRCIVPMTILMLAGCGTTYTTQLRSAETSAVQAQAREGVLKQLNRFAELMWQRGKQAHYRKTGRMPKDDQYIWSSCLDFEYLPGKKFVYPYNEINRQTLMDNLTKGVVIRDVQEYYEGCFDRADTNKDHKLVLDEFCSAIDAKLFGSSRVRKSDFDRGDKEWPRDRALSYSEFEELLFEGYVDSLDIQP